MYASFDECEFCGCESGERCALLECAPFGVCDGAYGVAGCGVGVVAWAGWYGACGVAAGAYAVLDCSASTGALAVALTVASAVVGAWWRDGADGLPVGFDVLSGVYAGCGFGGDDSGCRVGVEVC